MSYELRGSSQETELQKQEFFTSPDPIIKRIKEGNFDRKSFLKLMGASVALTTACVQKPAEKIIPYVDLNQKNEGAQYDFVKHGISYHYASACAGCSAGCGTIVKARDGRPLKLEGNPSHPVSQGALCATGQVELFNLYDPDRAKSPLQIVNGKAKISDWFVLDKEIKKVLAENKGKVAIATGPILSSSRKAFIDAFLAANGGGKHYEIDGTSPEEAISIAQEISYGKAIVPNYHFDKADVIVSIDADFLGTWISPVEFGKDFGKRRNLRDGGKSVNTFFAVESHPTTTGSNADFRIAIKPGDQRRFALALAKALQEQGVGGATGIDGIKVDSIASELGIPSESISKLAKALSGAKGRSLVVAGGTQAQTSDAIDLQVAVNMINSMLGNDGKTIDSGAVRKNGIANYSSNLKNLVKDLESGAVSVLFLFDSNPVYESPNSEALSKAFAKAKLFVSMNDRVDETSVHANWIAPTSHFLESWGESEPYAGLSTIIQPTIRPIYSTRSFEDSLITWNGGTLLGVPHFYDYLKEKWSKLTNWETLLQTGVYNPGGKAALEADRAPRAFRGTIKPLSSSPQVSGLSASLYTSLGLGNGRLANQSMLLELPDPISKVTWDNYVAISPQTAKEKGIKLNDLVKVTIEGKSLELPALIQVGLHKDAVGIALGFGRTHVGSVGNGVGKNLYPFAKETSTLTQFSGLPVTLEKVGKTYKLATTQDHHMMSPGKVGGIEWKSRPLILSTTIDEYKKNPKSGIPEPEIPKILKNGKLQNAEGANPIFPYNGYRWGLTVDLTSCTGCAACVVACSIENNVPAVGRDEVRVGREMHWIRIDRYFIGDPEKPETLEIAHQPVMCQHCEQAPCETVCPVAATVHSSEGTNDMVYNRCVGTRYCSNNCPYKVRRFNWMEHWTGTDKAAAPRHLGLNPDVTVRARGVMEKCSFCMGRIAENKIKAKNEGRKLKAGEIKTACQQTCPTDAISFGDINNADEEVTRLRKDDRAYRILEYLNVGPAVSYLSRVRDKV